MKRFNISLAHTMLFAASEDSGNTSGNGGGKWVAVGDNGKMAHSADGVNWTAVADSAFGTTFIHGIAYGNGKFVAVGGIPDKMAYSSDGVNWTAVADNAFGAGPAFSEINGIAYGGGKFVAVGGDYNHGEMAYSSDGVNWTAVTDSIFGSNESDGIVGIAYGGGKWVAADGGEISTVSGNYYDHGTVAHSADGVNWTAVTDSAFGTNPAYSNICGIAYGDGKWVVVGDKMAYSADGVTWIAVTDSPFKSTFSYSIAYDGGKFVVGGRCGKMAYSADGMNWTAVADSTFGAKSIYGIAYKD